jgi:hypothetical protein
MHPDPGHADSGRFRDRLIGRLRSAKFAAAAGETTITVPVAFGTLPAGAGSSQ